MDRRAVDLPKVAPSLPDYESPFPFASWGGLSPPYQPTEIGETQLCSTMGDDTRCEEMDSIFQEVWGHSQAEVVEIQQDAER